MFLYLYVLAAIIAVLGIIAVFRSTLDKIVGEPEKLPAYFNQFFIKVSMIEIVPLLIIVLGYMFPPDEQPAMGDALIPIVIIALLMVFNMFYIFSQRSPAGNIGKELQQRIQSFIFIAMALANAIPIVTIVCIFFVVNPS